MKLKLNFMFSLIFLFSQDAMSEPDVIYDSGRTISASKYKSLFKELKEIPDFGKNWALSKANKFNPNVDPSNAKNWLPIKTSKLTPGYVKAKPVQFNNMLNPICIIGSDQKSLQWIQKYHDVLIKNEAICWLVQASNINDVKKVVETLDGIPMSPSDGDALSDFFSLSHYPVLITARFLEQ